MSGLRGAGARSLLGGRTSGARPAWAARSRSVVRYGPLQDVSWAVVYVVHGLIWSRAL